MKLVKKSIFNFGDLNNVGLIYLKKSNSNIFLTLTDLDHRVVVCKTSGLTIKGSKRRKKAPFALEVLLKVYIQFLDYIKLQR